MSASNRSTGRSKKGGNKESITSPSNAVKFSVLKNENVKLVDKEKKQPSVEQISIAKLTQSTVNEIDPVKIKMVMEVTQKPEEEAIAALMDCEQDENAAIDKLFEENGASKTSWSITTKKKKKSPNNAVGADGSGQDNAAEKSDSIEVWNNKENVSYGRGRGTSRNNSGRGNGGRRGSNRSGFGSNKDNDKAFEKGGSYNRSNNRGENDGEKGDFNRDYRGESRGRRMLNGMSRGRGSRSGRGGGRTQRTFQNNTKDRGFFNQIDTWANPDTTDKKDDFPSTDDWDNEEYTGSLAVTQVFTPSVQVELETPTVIQSVTFTAESSSLEIKSKEESPSILPIAAQPPPPILQNASMASIVAGNSTQLTPAQSQYLKQLAAQTSENRQKAAAAASTASPQQPQQPQHLQPQLPQASFPQQPSAAAQSPQPSHTLVSQVVQQQKPSQPNSSLVYNSSMNIASQTYSPSQIQQPFPVLSQSSFLPNVTLPQPSQTFSSITISSQTFSPSPSSTFQSAPSITGAPNSFNGRTVEFTPNNYSDIVSNYNNAHGLQNDTNLSPRVKSQRSQSSAASKVPSGQVNDEISQSETSSVNATMKLLDVQFTGLEFANSENYDSASNVSDGGGISGLSNKYPVSNIGGASSVNSSSNHSELSVNSFQSSSTQQKQISHPPPGCISNVLVPNKQQQQQLNANESILSTDYSAQSIPNASTRSPILQELKSNAEIISTLSSYGALSADTSPFQSTSQQQQPPAFPKSVPSSFHAAPPAAASSYSTTLSYGSTPQAQVSASSTIYTTQHANNSNNSSSNLAPFSAYGNATNSTVSSDAIPTVTTPVQNSVYHNSSFQTAHPPVVTTFQSYYSYPSSIIPPYQVNAGGLTPTTYLGSQYGGPSLPNLGPAAATYGAAAPFHTNYNVTNSVQSPVVTVAQAGHKISSSSLNSSSVVSGKESQYDNVIPPSSSNTTTASSTGPVPSVTNVASSVASLTLSQTSANSATTVSSTKTAATTTSSKSSSGMLPPGMPAGVAPIVGTQYIMSQGSVPLYPPTAAFINYDELHYLQRGIHAHMPPGYLDVNYPGPPQTNLSTPGRDGLTVPFSDARFSRPDNTTSPVPLTAAASLAQQNTAPTHQQQLINPLLQTYAAAAYIYPYHQQYTTPVYQVTPTPTAGNHNTSNNALTAPPFQKGPASYSSPGYGSQFDSLGTNQNSLQDYGTTAAGKVVNATGGYATAGGQTSGTKGSGNTNPGVVPSQNTNPVANSTDLPVNMYNNKSHAGLSKVFHTGAPIPPPFSGSGGSTSGLANPPNANTAPYGSPLFLPGAANAAHHLHQTPHIQDNNDFRPSNLYPRSNYR